MRTLSGRLALGLLVLFIVAGAGFASAAWIMASQYQSEVSQKLNRALAANLVANRLPLRGAQIDQQALKEIFDLLMVINPQIEIYLLDLDGRILAHAAPPGHLIREHIDVGPIRQFLAGPAALPVRGDDPRSPRRRKVFSAASVPRDGPPAGYLYIILGGEQRDDIAGMLRGSYVLRLAIWGGLAGIGVTLVGAFVLVRVLTRRLRGLDAAMQQLRATDFSETPHAVPRAGSGDEIDRLTDTFARMAERITTQMRSLEEADALRRRLVANVSHDLRTPLASIQGYLETLLLKADTLPPAERRRYLETAARQSRHLTRLVGELFELARLDSHENAPRLEPFAPGELLQDVAQKFRLGAESGGVRLEVDFGHDVPFVLADIALIERALNNLVENALRHTATGGTVRLAVRRGGPDVEVSVDDTGTGIPADALPHLFDRFFQVERSQRSASERAGLGLAIVKRILELHGSTIAVSSTPGIGTRFVFRIPSAPTGVVV
jgi:signal transduction histidine kinase